jgi:hypothetical protein
MSTKIYNGYKIDNMSLFTFNQFVLDFTLKAKEVRGKLAAKFIANLIVDMVDDVTYIDEESYIKRHIKSAKDGTTTLADCKYHRLISEAIHTGEDRYARIQRTHERDPAVDFDIELVVIPFQDKILALLFCENREFTEIFESMLEVHYYGYWNNTDPDENCSDEEWEQRRMDWDLALPGLGVPADSGMTLNILDGFPSRNEIPKEEILKNIPSFERRVNVIAEELVLEEIYKRLKKENPTDDLSTGYQLYQQSRREMKSEKGQNMLLATKDKVSKTIVPEINDEIFHLHFSELEDWVVKNLKKVG